MPVDMLLRPDSRLLGLGTGDFSLYGAQPTDGTVVARIGPAGAPVAPTPDSAANGSEAGGASQAASPAQSPPTAADPAQSASPAPDSLATLSPQVEQPGPTDTHDADAAQPPVGGGSTSPVIIAQSPIAPADGSAVAGHAAATPTGATALDSFDIAQTAQAAISPLLDLLAGGSPVAAQLAQVDAALANTTQTIGDALGATTATLGGLTDTLAGAVQAPVHDIDQLIFSGSDPVGGITTLVDLVQTSELFDIGHTIAPVAPDASGSIVDDLVAEAAPAALLGEDAGHHDLLGGGHDGLHLGL